MNGTQEQANPAVPPSAPSEPQATPAPGGFETPPGTASRPEWDRSAQPPLAHDPRRKSPVLACILSLMPGLGQVYVGYYQRGFVHAIVAASLLALLASSNDFNPLLPLGTLLLVFFWMYNIIDAGRRAAMYNLVLAGGQVMDLPQDFSLPSLGGSLFGGLALIAGGIILLMHTRFDVSLDWIADWWPLLPVLFGVYLIGRWAQERSRRDQD